MMQLSKIIFVIFIGLLGANARALDLNQCGHIIAHENGMYNFNPTQICHGLDTCPKQFDAILEYNQKQPPARQIHFTKLSIRSLKDDTWIVAHNRYHYLSMSGILMRIDLEQLDSAQLSYYQRYGLNVYRLSDYIKHDPQAKLCYMLYFKSDPNENIINEVDQLGIHNRTVLESRNNHDAEWLHQHPGRQGNILFTGRVGNDAQLTNLLKKAHRYQNMWVIEVNVNGYTQKLVNRIHTETSYLTEVDSMPYDKFHEWHRTACQTPLKKMGSDLTMTSRPVDCLRLQATQK